MSILVLQSSWWGRESWLLCFICLPGVSWWLSGSSSRFHGVVCGLWLWYFLVILTYYFCGVLTSWLSCMWCFIVFCDFPVWCPGSGVVHDCIDCWSLPSFLLWASRDRKAPSCVESFASCLQICCIVHKCQDSPSSDMYLVTCHWYWPSNLPLRMFLNDWVFLSKSVTTCVLKMNLY